VYKVNSNFMLLREMEDFKTSLSSGNRYLPFKHWHASCSVPHAPYPPPPTFAQFKTKKNAGEKKIGVDHVATPLPSGVARLIVGGGAIFIYFCSALSISSEIDCFYSLWTWIYEYASPPMRLAIRHCRYPWTTPQKYRYHTYLGLTPRHYRPVPSAKSFTLN
jgi:hypothetical protein